MVKYLSTADASRVLIVTPATVRLMVRRGELQVAAVTEGGIQLFKRSHVEEVARKREKARGAKEGQHTEDGDETETN
jgi:hypothetical protein